MPTFTTVTEFEDHLVEVFRTMRADPEWEDNLLPTEDEVRQWTRAWWTDQGGRLRNRARPAKGATNAERGVFNIHRWHGSGGTLDGLMMARFSLGEDLFQRVDTYVQVVRHLMGKCSPSVKAWERTGLFS